MQETGKPLHTCSAAIHMQKSHVRNIVLKSARVQKSCMFQSCSVMEKKPSKKTHTQKKKTTTTTIVSVRTQAIHETGLVTYQLECLKRPTMPVYLNSNGYQFELAEHHSQPTAQTRNHAVHSSQFQRVFCLGRLFGSAIGPQPEAQRVRKEFGRRTADFWGSAAKTTDPEVQFDDAVRTTEAA